VVKLKYLYILFSFMLLTLSVLSSSCTSNSKPLEPTVNYSSLLRNLHASGVSVKEAEEIRQPFLNITGRIVVINGSDIQVFEYSTTEDLEADSQFISSDGFTINKPGVITSISWIGPPHFYKSGRIVVIYIGEGKTITTLLERLLGNQFAGYTEQVQTESPGAPNSHPWPGVPVYRDSDRPITTRVNESFSIMLPPAPLFGWGWQNQDSSAFSLLETKTVPGSGNEPNPYGPDAFLFKAVKAGTFQIILYVPSKPPQQLASFDIVVNP
jgi:hypothetical protein